MPARSITVSGDAEKIETLKSSGYSPSQAFQLGMDIILDRSNGDIAQLKKEAEELKLRMETDKGRLDYILAQITHQEEIHRSEIAKNENEAFELLVSQFEEKSESIVYRRKTQLISYLAELPQAPSINEIVTFFDRKDTPTKEEIISFLGGGPDA